MDGAVKLREAVEDIAFEVAGDLMVRSGAVTISSTHLIKLLKIASLRGVQICLTDSSVTMDVEEALKHETDSK